MQYLIRYKILAERNEAVMKQLKIHLHRLSELQIAVILFLLSIVIGVFFANIFRDSYAEQMMQYENIIFPDISSGSINQLDLFQFIIVKNFKEFAIFWVLCITILGIPYMVFKIISFGFTSGFFISAITMQYGIKGLLLVLVYVFPHGLVYLPIALLSLYKGFLLCSSIYHDKRNRMNGMTSIIKSQLLLIFFLSIALFVGSFLEAFAGSFLLKKTLRFFI